MAMESQPLSPIVKAGIAENLAKARADRAEAERSRAEAELRRAYEAALGLAFGGLAIGFVAGLLFALWFANGGPQ